MEPPHITEFGSERFLKKIYQSEAASGPAAQASTSGVADLPQSQFILPIRGHLAAEFEEPIAKAGETKRPEKKGFLGFRSKFHAKASSTSPSIENVDRRASLADSTTRQSVPFDHLFQCLPNELQIEIIASLPLSDILNLRLASRSLHALVSFNETPITRYHLDHHIPAYAKRLYPVPEGGALNFHYLCGLWHRLHVAAKLAYFICEWVSKEYFRIHTAENKLQFAPQKERMRRRLIPLLFTTFHFFETYRKLHLKYLAQTNDQGLRQQPYTMNPIETEIMNMYDDRTLLRVHEVFPLIMASFCRRLRPPTYVGRVERSLRGYLREKPPDEVHTAILCIGGLRQVERIWEVKGYNARRDVVDAWYSSLTWEPVESEPKRRRGMLGLKRKKSALAVGKSTTTGHGFSQRTTEPPPSNAEFFQSVVFNTSLSAGMPMGPLSKDQVKALLPDLPVLQKIWVETAEAMIMDRKIVERPSDIRRGAQMLTDLLREDGFKEEDQWWYGTSDPDFVRPNLDAIEEDTLE